MRLLSSASRPTSSCRVELLAEERGISSRWKTWPTARSSGSITPRSRASVRMSSVPACLEAGLLAFSTYCPSRFLVTTAAVLVVAAGLVLPLDGHHIAGDGAARAGVMSSSSRCRRRAQDSAAVHGVAGGARDEVPARVQRAIRRGSARCSSESVRPVLKARMRSSGSGSRAVPRHRVAWPGTALRCSWSRRVPAHLVAGQPVVHQFLQHRGQSRHDVGGTLCVSAKIDPSSLKGEMCPQLGCRRSRP